MSRQRRSGYREQEYAIVWREGLVQTGESVASGELEELGLRGLARRELAAAWAACGMFECVALGYLGVSSALIILFAENLAHPVRLFGLQALVAGGILVLCRVEARVASRHGFGEQARTETDRSLGFNLAQTRRGTDRSVRPTFWHFWRHWYPHLYFLFCFEELGRLVHLVQPGWQDAKLIVFDHWLTGICRSFPLAEALCASGAQRVCGAVCFTSATFVFLLILGAILYHRREWGSYWAVMTYSAVGYSLGYIIAMLFPVQSPWFTFAGMWHGELAGGPFTAAINFIEKCGRVHGAAFPSQHVAGAVAALWGAWRHRRWLFWVFLPFVLCMCVSTVYVRNHYVADVLGGLVTGTLGYVIGRWLLERWLPVWKSTD